ncbi:DNA-binding protein D-ETS-3 [Poeciliopsis prolifica]|uniref:DNA-binding protein D-ETS-3 n=1 Tax=Poeciliopsis prolifica TaxID=188132 RepID=UPI0024140D61|nr:DNA-binding protein D-ETS-3 [Poeciliopsis prolifica]
MGGYKKGCASQSHLGETAKRLSDRRYSSVMDNQSDLEVILEFLEEYYRQSIPENAEKESFGLGEPVHGGDVALDQTCDESWAYHDASDVKPVFQTFLNHDAQAIYGQSTTATLSECGSVPNSVAERQSSKHPAAAAGRGRRLRLFHFLFEMLQDPSMAHCLSWAPAPPGVFSFSSRNKDQVAALWGQRKGNKRPMTYQKMSRALRNYARSGHIFKVKKKLTYQFSRDTLISLQKGHRGDP